MSDSKIKTSDEDLRRFVAAEWWLWMPGMLVDHRSGPTVARVARMIEPFVPPEGLRAGQVSDFSRPVVSDDATAGCLLKMYSKRHRELFGDTNHLGLEDMTGPLGAHTASQYASIGDFLVAVLLEMERTS